MGKLKIAKELAEATGSKLDDAMRWVDDVGAARASKVASKASDSAGGLVKNWWKPTTVVGTIGGTGALAWRQQDVEQAKEIANAEQSYTSAFKSIMNSDLPPDKKQEMIENLNEGSPSDGDAGDDGDDDDEKAWWEKLLGDAGGLETKVLMLIVLLAVLNYSLGAD